MEEAEYLLIGGGLAGGYAASAIRERDGVGRVFLVSNENHLPYDRVPLSKAYLTSKTKLDNLFFRKREFYEQNRVELLAGRTATAVDRKNRLVTLDDGTEIHYVKLLIATGGRARKINLPGAELKRIHYLRTIEDCEALKAEMSSSRKAVVIGGGFIGCELAAAFSAHGLDTTIIEVAPTLLSVALDPETAEWIGGYFTKKGVKVMTNCTADAFVGEAGNASGVETKSGTIPADFVAVGVGIAPNTELAEKAGLKTDKGIVVNEFLETETGDIFAAGDVARFYSPLFKHHMRLEHYDVAVKHGKTAGANMAGERRSFSDLPYFFSFMFEMNINVYGDMSARERTIRRGSLTSEKGFFQFYLAGDRVVAFLSMNKGRDEINLAKRIILSGKLISDSALLSVESRSLETFL
jgi:NADPH-dependent 2,4-dienoyl-CoA reductase/sulfur reductase-like enzyme